MKTQTYNFEYAKIEPWPEAINGELLLNEIVAIIKRYVILPKWAGETLALWTLHTYAFHLRDVSTYLGIESRRRRSGKTTLLAVLGEIVNRPIYSCDNCSPDFLPFVEEMLPIATLLLDDVTFLPDDDIIRGILDSGYTRETAFVVHPPTRRSPSLPLVRFSCWCPKVIVATDRLPETLLDRSIVIRKHRINCGNSYLRLRNLDATNLKRHCALFVHDHAASIACAKPRIPTSLKDRAAEIWKPLLVLGDLAGGHWPETARQAAVSLTETAHGISIFQ